MSKRKQPQTTGRPKFGNRALLLVMVCGVIALFVSPYIFSGGLYSPDVDLEDYGTIHVFYNVMNMGTPAWHEVSEGDPVRDVDSDFNTVAVSHLRVLGGERYINEDIDAMLYCKDTGQKLVTVSCFVRYDVFYGDYMFWGFLKDSLLEGEHTYYIVLYGAYDASHSIGAQTFDFVLDHPTGGILPEPVVDSEKAQYAVETGVETDIIFTYVNLWDTATWKVVVDGDPVGNSVAAYNDGEDHDVVFAFTAKTAKIYNVVFQLTYGASNVRVDVRVVSTGEDVVTTTTTTTTTTTNTTVTNSTTTGETTTDGSNDWEGYIKEMQEQIQFMMIIMISMVGVFAAIMILMVYSGGRRR